MRCGILCLIILGWLIIPVAHAEDAGPTARGMFALLPPSIFENTVQGLEESAKQGLLREGYSEFWRITSEAPDSLLITQVPFGDKTVEYHIFRNNPDGSVLVAAGTGGDAVCSLELWRMDTSGKILQAELPPEPKISEFYAKRPRSARYNPYSVLLCLNGSILSARPIYWRKGAMVRPVTDYEIFYEWNDGEFTKIVKPVSKRNNGMRP